MAVANAARARYSVRALNWLISNDSATETDNLTPYSIESVYWQYGAPKLQSYCVTLVSKYSNIFYVC